MHLKCFFWAIDRLTLVCVLINFTLLFHLGYPTNNIYWQMYIALIKSWLPSISDESLANRSFSYHGPKIIFSIILCYSSCYWKLDEQLWHWQTLDKTVSLPMIPDGGMKMLKKEYDLCLTGEVRFTGSCTRHNCMIEFVCRVYVWKWRWRWWSWWWWWWWSW